MGNADKSVMGRIHEKIESSDINAGVTLSLSISLMLKIKELQPWSAP
jgi:hypothetical protein